MPSEYPTRQQMENQADLLRRIANAGYAGICEKSTMGKK